MFSGAKQDLTAKKADAKNFVFGRKAKFQLGTKAKSFMKQVQQLPFEVGGRLDFNLDKVLERVQSRFGIETSISENFNDFEVEFHTHPTTSFLGKIEYSPPSFGDYIGFLASGFAYNELNEVPPTQLAVVVSSRYIYVIYHNKSFLKRFQGSKKQQLRKYIRYLQAVEPVVIPGFLEKKGAHDRYLAQSDKKFGAKTYVFEWKQPVWLSIKPTEPLLKNYSKSKME